MGKLLVDVDREALERVRVKLGARSHAAALRILIETADGLMAGASKLPVTPRAKVTDPGKTYFRPNPKPSKK